MKQYVVGKLVTGETIMGELKESTPDAYVISYPIHIKTYPKTISPGKIEETIAATPLCSYTAADLYKIARSNFIFAAELHEMYVPLYNRIVDEYFREVEVEDPREDSEEDMTVDDLEDVLTTLQEQMKQIAERTNERKDEEDIRSTFVRGNETKH